MWPRYQSKNVPGGIHSKSKTFRKRTLLTFQDKKYQWPISGCNYQCESERWLYKQHIKSKHNSITKALDETESISAIEDYFLENHAFAVLTETVQAWIDEVCKPKKSVIRKCKQSYSQKKITINSQMNLNYIS
jgi:hypothetical protein